ncbi:hypothetical protein LOTGIDRAFT_199259 [Lottia gigantea]|uniref:Uncharacterized protein n=1 Tax=Lottia gigantea TaxID=225164 RepID=V4B089_LOTGI|nr:hypothetical protein LOTGIDRAFT_199259 [Lottia gigantea]ESP03413.1 hypothetical protein LOTGIDRAFT_199259 [Lottia gigantea]
MTEQVSGVLFSYSNRPKSAHHDSCIPKAKAAQPAKNHTEGDYRGCDGVTQNKIWTENVQSEKRCRKNWSHDWGYLTDYDARGNLKQKEEMPEKVALYSDNVPNTNSAMYGNRINTDLGQKMQAMEFKFYAEKRRRKMGKDLICY